MVLCEDGDCGVCLLPYSRMDRIPRMLHCRHTFCELCLETISQAGSGLLTVGCPLCRRVTCVGHGLGIQQALWVNSKLWEQIPEEEEEEEDALKQEAEEQGMEIKAECASSGSSRTKLKLPVFLRRFRLTKRHQERIVPGSNVEMKSWRRLSAAERV
ncbi:RING finger protein 208 isoform X1 [Brachionichthys hirsutus]|uniref:RING finger protein 208 isoform X1 n=1 Tax=Brachionichthys hirsutus TaxID=412623 RepID=UPI003604816F